MSPILRKRVHRYLDAAWARGAFDQDGSLFQLSADAIADGIATDWDAANRYGLVMVPGASRRTSDEIEPIVASWLARNSERV